MIRKPIITVLGHVDSGKTTILDLIRQTTIAEKEAGKITQHVGATNVPLETIERVCGDLLKKAKIKIKVPGLLFIDTPGHKAFTSLRKRGGNLADISILVVDIMQGIEPQTIESIEILKQYKTPFIIALNKIDLISGWQKKEGLLLKNIEEQSENVEKELDKKLYNLVGKLYELGFNAERFDRVDDYSKKVCIIPISAKTGEGLAELIMTLVGLAQKFLEENLEVEVKGKAKGTVLEVKEEKGLGKTIDVIIYDGSLKQNDLIVIGGLEEPIVTKVKALFEPKPLTEIRDKKSKFDKVKEVSAASGVKISAPDLNVIAGMPLRSTTKKDLEKTKEEVQKEVREVLIETDKEGIIIKADTIGGLEALTNLLKEKDISVKKAGIGDINKKDVSEAESEKNILNRVILGFNIKVNFKGNVEIITNDIIYKIIEDFEKWQKEEERKLEEKELKKLVLPCKVRIMSGYVFRQSNPAVVGIEVLGGTLKTNLSLTKGNKEIASVKSIQSEGKNVDEAKKGEEVAISLPGVIVGRQIKEGDILYSSISEEDFIKLKKKKKFLKEDEIEILKELAEIKRKENAVWGV